MAIRKVVRLGHPILRQKARNLSVEEIKSPEIQGLIQDLRDTQAENGGIGIAAPQVAMSVRVAIIEFSESSTRYPGMGAQPLTVFINAQVTTLDSTEQTYWEGCLSVPGLRGRVSRPRKVRVDYLDEQAQPKSLIAEGFLATVFQHELDHLDGVLFVDRVKTQPGFTELAFSEEYEQFHRVSEVGEHCCMTQSISIITAIHNGLPMNRLYWKALCENTTVPFELVIVDNHSTDGSELFFRELSKREDQGSRKVVYLRNEHNQSYPASQIQGMAAATHDILAFFNNDIWMPRGWEFPFLRAFEKDPRVILSPSGQDAQPYQSVSDRLKRRWIIVRRLSKLWAFLLRKSEEERLWKSLLWMYGSLNDFRSPTPQVATSMDGIKGDSVVVHRSVVSELGGLWDLQIQAADWHLYLKAASHAEKNPGFPLPQVLLDTYTHHFGRYSISQAYEPLPPGTVFRTIDEVWSPEVVRRLWWGYRLPR